MNVAHLSCGVEGGADIAAVRIHRALMSAGVNSKFYHLGHASPDDTFTRFYAREGMTDLVKRWLNIYKNRFVYGRIKPGTEAFTDPWGNFNLTFDQLNFSDVQVITLHWIAAYFNLKPFLESVPANVKFVWTMHDLNPITGGCHYTAGCNKFEAECRECPQLYNDGIVDRALKNFRIKADAYRQYLKGRVHLVADSYWMGEMIKRSKLLGNEPLSVIHYPIETNAFRYIGKNEARKALGLDPNRFILLFGSGALDNVRKGIDILIDALREVSDPALLSQLQLLTFGSGNMNKLMNGLDVRSFGKVSAHELLTLLYNAADYFIMPSREEALGQTAMEAVCCGTPVISFPVGGLRDTVDASNGIFAEAIDKHSLALAITSAFKTEFNREEISKRARNRYAYDVKVQEYLKVYKSLL
ncbi:MAG TPA: glycosyltransferase [Cyclobacteriaceae bacterium]|nr:glycosyltransferase [Cyclobacteriaceae bacterium]